MFPSLSSMGIKPVNTSTLPKGINGWRIAMLTQYSDSGSPNNLNPSWTVTTLLTRYIMFLGKKVSTSSWNPSQQGQNVQGEFPEHRSFWIGTDDGYDATDAEMIAKNYGYCYLHDSLSPPPGFDTCVLTLSEYLHQVSGSHPPFEDDDADTPMTQPSVHAE